MGGMVFALLLGQLQALLARELSLPADRLKEYLAEMDPVPTVEWLSCLGSRIPGYEGSDRAAEYVIRKFRECGLDPQVETFQLAVPVDKGASLTVRGSAQPVEIRCVWPNLVRTSKLPAAGLEGPLIYARSGHIQDFNGRPVQGSVVLIDFNCATRWLNASMLGAKAVIFVEPEVTAFRAEATQKFLLLPAPIPRYWISRKSFEALAQAILGPEAPEPGDKLAEALARVGFSGEGGRPAPTVALQANMVWENATARNITAEVPGTDPALAKETIVVEAYYDSISVVPTLAPGADAACGIAVQLELARLFSREPPRRTVRFVATSGHFQALAGIREWTARHILLQKEKGNQAYEYFLGKTDKDPKKSVPGELQNLLQESGKLQPAAGTKLSRQADTIGAFINRFRILIGDLGLRQTMAHEFDELYDLEKDMRQAVAAQAAVRLAGVSSRLTDLYKKVYPRLEARASRETPEAPPALFIGLDLSSRNQQMGVFYKGNFYDQFGSSDEFRLQRQMAAAGDTILEWADGLKKLVPDLAGELVSGVVPKRGRDWRSYMPDEIALDGEVPLLAGIGSLSFVTTNDTRASLDTPNDDLAQFNPENLRTQARFLFPLFYEILNSPALPLSFKLDDHFGDIYAKVIEDQLIAYLPQIPVPGAIVTAALRPQKSIMGVRGQAYYFTNDEGVFELFGASRERWVSVTCWAFKLDAKDGSIEKVTNLAGNAGRPFPLVGQSRKWADRAFVARPGIPSARRERRTDQRLPVFPCASVMIFDLLDQLYLTSFKELKILDARSNTEPKYYAYFIGRSAMTSYSEPVAVAFAEPEVKTKIKLIFSAGLLGARFTLINTTGDNVKDLFQIEKGQPHDLSTWKIVPAGKIANPEGMGFVLREREQAIVFSPYQAVKDMWVLDHHRLNVMEETGIRNKQVNELHLRSCERLMEAERRRGSGQYDEFLNLAREAWALEARAYPEVMRTANDVVRGIIFYFAILLPFAFFAERLFFSFADIRKQLFGIAGFFMAVYIVLEIVHPAFRISKTPMIILDGFLILAMGSIVILIVMNKFNVQMAKVREKTAAVHGTDVARGSAALAAFILGISNMRRRKVRTALTCITLILLTFTVMSFTSFDKGLSFNKIETRYKPSYQGLMLRRRDWGPLEEHAYYSIADYFRTYPDSRIALRTWKIAPQVGDTLSLQVTNADDPTKTFAAQALIGLNASEEEVTRPSRQIVAGRWFTPDEDKGEFVCIVPKRMAEFLGIRQDDFEPGKHRVAFSGDEYRVVGIIDGGEFYENKDLDNEPLTPVDFIEMQSRQGKDEQSKGAKGDQATESEEALPELYIHLEGDNVLVIPTVLSVQLGASLRSIAIKMEQHSNTALDKILEDYVRRLKLILFAGLKGDTEGETVNKVLLYSSRGSLSVSGLKGLLIPILIAALIVFNTMLGSVYERTREISIYASVGLAPFHISALFLAESCVYATLGAIIGYLVGQIVAYLVVTLNVWQDLSLNYSSTAAVVTTLVVVGTVLLSTVFPARKAAELSVPDETRKLTLPKPDGDDWIFDFPFTVSKAEAVALNLFLYDYFKAHDEDSIGRFCADRIEFSASEEDGKPVYHLKSLVWIAPLDMGISQRVWIETREAPFDEKVDVLRFHLHRESGEVDTWRRMNTGFFRDLRKQLLIWRLVEAGHKRELTVRGYGMIGKEPPPETLQTFQRAIEALETRRKREAEVMARIEGKEAGPPASEATPES